MAGVRLAKRLDNGMMERFSTDPLNGAAAGQLRDARIEFWGDATGTNLTKANLTNAILTGTIFGGANLSGVTGLTNRSFAGYDFSNTKLIDVDLSGANLTGANLRGADMQHTNLTGANLTRAELFGANIISTNLTGVIWGRTGCPWGGTSDTRCSAFARQPDPNFKPNGTAWYEYRSPANGAIPAGTRLGGTIGAPIGNESPWTDLSDDGVQGAVKNFSATTVLIRTDWGDSSGGRYEEAILEPGAELSYQLDSDTDPKARRSLLIYSIDDKGNPVGNPTRLLLDDKYVGGVVVAFWPAGYSDDKSAASKMLYEKDTVRFTWPENSPTTNIWVKRETDGWSVPASAAYLSWYPNPNDSGTTDWGIVSIHIDTFPAA